MARIFYHPSDENIERSAKECARQHMESGDQDPESIVTDYAVALGVPPEEFYELVRKHLPDERT